MSTVIAGTESGTSLTSLFHETLQRLARQGAHCKLGAALGLAIVLVLALQAGSPNILWGATPLGLLALADAGYTAQARRIAEFSRRLNGQKESVRPGDLMQLQASGWGFQGALSGLAGFLSFTVWPFYLCLAGLAIGLGSTVVVPMVKVAPTGPRPPGFTPPSAAYPQQLPSNSTRPAVNPYKPQIPRPFSTPSVGGTVPQNSSTLPVRPGATPPNITIPRSPTVAPKIGPAPVAPSPIGAAPATPAATAPAPGAAAPAPATTVLPAAPAPPSSSSAPQPSPLPGQTK